MNLVKKNLIYTESASADTEIKYTLVDAMMKSPELLLLTPPQDDATTQKRIFNLAKKILRQFKLDGKIAYFAVPANFQKGDTVSQYVFDMFPELPSELPEIKSGYDFLLVRF